MAIYEWNGRNSRGEAVRGKLDGLNEGSVTDELISMGVVPLKIAAATPVTPAALQARRRPGRLFRQAVSVEDIVVFSRQMHTLSKAGVPIFRAFSGLESSATKPEMIALLHDIRSSLDQGRELSAALARHPRVFSPFYISMVQIGEMTGRLAEVFLNLCEHLEFERDVRERVTQALRYPVFVMIAMAVAVSVLTVFVIPVFAKVFESFHAQLPLLTRAILGLSGWMVRWWPLLLLGIATGSFAIRRYLHTTAGRYLWDAFKLRLPVVGDVLLKGTLARFARSFALASQSSVPLVQAMTVVALTVDNVFIAERINQMRDGIEQGGSISKCATGAGIFTPLVLQMISVGEETGEFDALMFEIARMYKQQTDYSIKGLTAAIEPILLVLIAVLVLLLALGVFLPLWSLGQTAVGRGG